MYKHNCDQIVCRHWILEIVHGQSVVENSTHKVPSELVRCSEDYRVHVCDLFQQVYLVRVEIAI